MVLNAFEKVAFWRTRRQETGHLLLALDFDGTLAPIVPQPDDARMVPAARAVMEQLLKRTDTDVAVVSGRSLPDLQRRCDMPGLYYAGNHGLQIAGPGVHETRAEALALLPRVRAFAERLQRALASRPGVYLEDKQLSLSVHYRPVDDAAEQQRIVALVEAAYQAQPEGVRLTYGKKVVEVRPDIDWNKGDATLYLLESVQAARNSEVFAIFIGDDLTDEDAFRVLRERGAGILVAAAAVPGTCATARVESVDQVVALLEEFATST